MASATSTLASRLRELSEALEAAVVLPVEQLREDAKSLEIKRMLDSCQKVHFCKWLEMLGLNDSVSSLCHDELLFSLQASQCVAKELDNLARSLSPEASEVPVVHSLASHKVPKPSLGRYVQGLNFWRANRNLWKLDIKAMLTLVLSRRIAARLWPRCVGLAGASPVDQMPEDWNCGAWKAADAWRRWTDIRRLCRCFRLYIETDAEYSVHILVIESWRSMPPAAKNDTVYIQYTNAIMEYLAFQL